MSVMTPNLAGIRKEVSPKPDKRKSGQISALGTTESKIGGGVRRGTIIQTKEALTPTASTPSKKK